jgi:hypothetical protein
MTLDGVTQQAFMLTTNLNAPQQQSNFLDQLNNYQLLMKVVHHGLKYLYTTPKKKLFSLKISISLRYS